MRKVECADDPTPDEAAAILVAVEMLMAEWAEADHHDSAITEWIAAARIEATQGVLRPRDGRRGWS